MKSKNQRFFGPETQIGFLKKTTLSIFVLIFLLPAIASAATYYVSTTGNDANPGTIDQPFKTLQKAANTVHAGDTLYIRGGRYYEGASFFLQNGTETAPITVTAYPGERVILDGNNYTIPAKESGSCLIMVYGSWYTVKNLEMTASGGTGICLIGQHNIVDSVFSYKNWGGGILLTGNYDTAQNSRSWSNSMNNEGYTAEAKGEGWAWGITCARYPDHCTIRNCTAWDNWGEGISTFETLHVTIEDCTSYDNQQNYYISDTKYTVLRRSLSYCTPGNAIDPHVTQNGILIGDEKGVPIPLGDSGTRYPSSNNTIINNIVIGCDRNLAAGIYEGLIIAHNTFANCDGDCAEPASVLFYGGNGTTTRFINNIIIQDDNLPIAIEGTLSNIVRGNNLWSRTPPTSARSSDDIIGDPKLARQATLSPGQMTPEWFKLLADSPAINKAKILTEITDDFFKTTRGNNPDIGAHEYIGSTPPTPVPGDLNGDGKVDVSDLNLVASDFGKTSNLNNAKSDTNIDGIVDIYDVVYVASRIS